MGEIPIFVAEDILRVQVSANASLKAGMTEGDAARSVNWAFKATIIMAEGDRAKLADSEQRKWLQAVGATARQLLRALGLSEDPSFYCRKPAHKMLGDNDFTFRDSPAYYQLYMANVLQMALPPSPADYVSGETDSTAPEFTAILEAAINQARAVPLTKEMLPIAIAKSEYDLNPTMTMHIVNGLIRSFPQFSPEVLEAQYRVGRLLEVAPRVIALLIALSELGQSRRSRQRFASFSRTFQGFLFGHLAKAYHDITGKQPITIDSLREPNGPATLWVEAVLHIAQERLQAVRDVRHQEFHTDILAEIERAFRLKRSAKAKRIQRERRWALPQVTRQD